MLDAGHDLTGGRLIGTQLVGDQPLWRHVLLLQQTSQQTLDRLGVSAGLDDLVEDVAVLVDGAPQPASLFVDANNDLVEMPDTARRRWLSTEASRIVGAVFSTSAADRLVGNGNPALDRHFLDLVQADIESD